MWSGVRLTRKQLTSRPDHFWPELWDKMGRNAKLKEEQKWAIEKLKLDPQQRAAVDKEWEKLEKIPAWNLTKVRSKKEVIDEARTKGAKLHFVSQMDMSFDKCWHQKWKGRVVFRGDIVKDDSGSYAVLTEQGSSASQMTAAKVMEIISRLSGCAGQAADAESAYTQVKMEDAQFFLNKTKTKSECPDIWIRLPRCRWPKS